MSTKSSSKPKLVPPPLSGYILVTAKNPEDLQTQVADLLPQGWQPQGGPTALSELRGVSDFWIAQALIK